MSVGYTLHVHTGEVRYTLHVHTGEVRYTLHVHTGEVRYTLHVHTGEVGYTLHVHTGTPNSTPLTVDKDTPSCLHSCLWKGIQTHSQTADGGKGHIVEKETPTVSSPYPAVVVERDTTSLPHC
jgi:hypothetical protein